MNTRTHYGQLADKLDYPAIEQKLEQLAEREPPKTRKTAADVLEPLRENILALYRKGWTSGQLVEELKAAGVPISPARFRDCLSRWLNSSKRSAKPRSTQPAHNQGTAGTTPNPARNRDPLQGTQNPFRSKEP